MEQSSENAGIVIGSVIDITPFKRPIPVKRSGQRYKDQLRLHENQLRRAIIRANEKRHTEIIHTEQTPLQAPWPPLAQKQLLLQQHPLQLTEEQTKERERSIELHMQLLQHSVNCIGCKVTSKTSYHMHTYT